MQSRRVESLRTSGVSRGDAGTVPERLLFGMWKACLLKAQILLWPAPHTDLGEASNCTSGGSSETRRRPTSIARQQAVPGYRTETEAQGGL